MLDGGRLADQSDCDDYEAERGKCKWYRISLAKHCDCPEFKERE